MRGDAIVNSSILRVNGYLCVIAGPEKFDWFQNLVKSLNRVQEDTRIALNNDAQVVMKTLISK